ncbi:hypothetical protein VUR80DRAFT_6328 [Thermomyces stellatus]
MSALYGGAGFTVTVVTPAPKDDGQSPSGRTNFVRRSGGEQKAADTKPEPEPEPEEKADKGHRRSLMARNGRGLK